MSHRYSLIAGFMVIVVIRYILSVIVCSLFITVSATQLVLSNLSRFELPAISLTQRLETTWQDILNFGPTILMIVALAYLVGFIIVWLLSKKFLNRSIWGFIAGLTAVPAAVAFIDHVLGINLIYITIHGTGWFVLLMGSVLGSMVFYRDSINREAS